MLEFSSRFFVHQKRIETGLVDLESPRGSGRLLRPKNNKDLDDAAGLLKDYRNYKDLCAHPERKDALLRNIDKGNSELKAFEGKTTKELLKHAQ